MELDELEKWNSIKICTHEDREFIIEKPFYDKIHNIVAGCYVYEVTKKKTGATFNTEFPLEEIKNIEYLSTKDQSRKLDKRIGIIIIIVFAITALLSLKKMNLSIWVIIYSGIAIWYYSARYDKSNDILEALFWPLVMLYEYFSKKD